MEFHGCTVDNSTTGEAIEDDPQGEGGAFSVATGTTLVLADCVLRNNYCGKKVRLFLCVLGAVLAAAVVVRAAACLFGAALFFVGWGKLESPLLATPVVHKNKGWWLGWLYLLRRGPRGSRDVDAGKLVILRPASLSFDVP